MFWLQCFFLTKDHASFQKVVKLTNVTRPVVAKKQFHDFVGNVFYIGGSFLIDFLELVFHQKGNIFFSFCQRWDMYFHDIEPVI